MALEHAILMSLEEQAGSGYELTRRFEKSIGYFWGATHQQIYRTLKRMVQRDWVAVEQIPQRARPDKKVYRVTEQGSVELERWLSEPGDPVELRDELALKVRGASFGDIDAVIGEIERHHRLHAERLAVYQAVRERDFPDPQRLSGQSLHQYLVLRGGIRAEQGLVEWCEEMLLALRDDDRPTNTGVQTP